MSTNLPFTLTCLLTAALATSPLLSAQRSKAQRQQLPDPDGKADRVFLRDFSA